MATNNSTNNIAAAGSLTGTTLKSTVTASSLESVGTLLDLTVTNTIAGSINGNAATVTNATLTKAISVTTGNVVLAGNADESSELTLGSGVSSVSGANTGDQNTITGNAGSATVLETARTINGVSFDGSANISIPVADFTWNTTAGTSINLIANNAYFANNAGLVTYTLPLTATVGDRFIVSYQGAGGWAIAQNADQKINLSTGVTTTGVGGSLASSAAGDTVTLVCMVEDVTFQVIASMGNITTV